MARSDQDSPWKELLDQDLERCFAFFYPDIHADLDWTRDYESLEQEFRPMVPASRRGRRVADKLIKTFRKENGDPRFFHLEVQARRERHFAHRVHVYNSRAEDRFGCHIVSLVLLVDDSPTWRPRGYRARQYECTRILTFGVRKLLDWRGREAELRVHDNPVALFVLAALEAKRTRTDDAEREVVKLALIETLTERKMDAEELRHWYRYLDWLLPLPPEADARIATQARAREEKTKMPFVPYIERVAMEKGLEKGLEEGREEGRLGLLQGLALALKFKFGEAGAQFAAELREQKWERLQAILAAVETAASVEDLRKLP